MKVFINNKLINISPFYSIYSLKYNTKNINSNLYFAGKELKDSKTLFESGLYNNCQIFLHNSNKGGISTISPLWYFFIIFFLIIIPLFITGFCSYYRTHIWCKCRRITKKILYMSPYDRN